MSRIDQRLSGIYSLAYLGSDAVQPTNVVINGRNPTASDRSNVYVGSWWLNTASNNLFYLASLANGMAIWVNISSSVGAAETLSGNTGGPITPTANNINLVGDGPTITSAGNVTPGTLTLAAGGPELLTTLTGNTGGPVRATASNINVVGAGPISVAGNPGTSTLTISQSPAVVDSFVTQTGTAVPIAGFLNIIGSNGVTTSGSGNTVTVLAASSTAQSFITSPATGTAIPAAGVLTFVNGTDTTISASGSTITINGTGSGGGGIPSYSTGTFTPGLAFTGTTATLSIAGSSANYTQIGNTVFVTIRISFTSGGTGLLTITGLPFAVNSSMSDHVISASTWFTRYNLSSGTPPNYLWIRFLAGTTTAAIYAEFTNEAATPFLTANAMDITISGWYYT